MEQVKSKRGGTRQGAGRPSAFGNTTRRDMRVTLEMEREAVRLGGGNFAEGMRIITDEYMNLRARYTAIERPPLDAPVLAFLDKEGRWAIAHAEETPEGVVFREAHAPQAAHTADAWRPLPDAP